MFSIQVFARLLCRLSIFILLPVPRPQIHPSPPQAQGFAVLGGCCDISKSHLRAPWRWTPRLEVHQRGGLPLFTAQAG